MMRKTKMHTGFWFGKPKARGKLKELVELGRIIL
jgi:hypothetical protein